MSTEPQWGRVLQKNLDNISPSVAGVGKAMGELEKSISMVDRWTQKYVNTIQSLHKAFSGVAITAQLKVYEDYAAILDKNNKRTLVYGQSIDGLVNRYNKLSKATNLSVREIGELNAIAAQSIIGKKDFSAIDSQIKRINQYSASVKEVHDNFVNLLQIQQKYGVGFKGGGGGGMLRNLTTSELSSMPNELFFSAAQDAFLGGKKRETGSYKDLSRFQENRKKFENDYIDSLKQTSGTLFNISDKMKTLGEWSGFGKNTPGAATATGLVGGMVGTLAIPTMWSLGKRLIGRGGSAAAAANNALGGGGSGVGGGVDPIAYMSGAGSGLSGKTNIDPGNGTTLGRRALSAFGNRFSRGNLLRGGSALAIGALAHPIIDWAAPKLGMDQGAADKSKSILRYAAGGAAAGSLFGPIGTGIGAAAGGILGVYQNYGAGSTPSKKNDVAENERLKQLQGEISKELSAHELNYGRINELVTKYNGLVKGTGQELNENLAVVTSLKDQIDNVAVVQNRINDILQRQASSYQELSQVYGDGLRMGKESEAFARSGLKSQELQLQVDRDFFYQKMELQKQLQARIDQGDESAKAQQQEEQVLMEKKYKISFNQQDILAKHLEIQGKLAQIQNTRIDLDTRATDIQEQNADVAVQQARTWTSISQSMKMGVLPEASAILNQVSAVNEKVKIQEQGYINIQKHLAEVNAEIMQLQRGGLSTVQKQEQLQFKMAERNKLQIKGEQQVNKILESRADQLSSLLTLREKAVSALPEVAMMGGQYEMSMDVGLETGAALFRSDANQFVGTSAGRFGMTTPSGGVGHGGGFMMGRGPGVYAMNQPLALGAMPSQGTMGAAAQTVGSYHTGGTVGSKEGLPLDGREVLIKAKTGEHVIPRFEGGWNGLLSTDERFEIAQSLIEEDRKAFNNNKNKITRYERMKKYRRFDKIKNSNKLSGKLAKTLIPYLGIEAIRAIYDEAYGSGTYGTHKGDIGYYMAGMLHAAGSGLGINRSYIDEGKYNEGSEWYKNIENKENEAMLKNFMLKNKDSINKKTSRQKSIEFEKYRDQNLSYYSDGMIFPSIPTKESLYDQSGFGNMGWALNPLDRDPLDREMRVMHGETPRREWKNKVPDKREVVKSAGYEKNHPEYLTDFQYKSSQSQQNPFNNETSSFRPNISHSYPWSYQFPNKPKLDAPEIKGYSNIMPLMPPGYAGGGRTLPGPTGGFIAELHPNEVVLNQKQVSRLGLSHSDFSKAGVPGFGGGGLIGNVGGSNHVSVSLDDSGSLRAVVSSSNASNSIMRQNNFVNANQHDGGQGI